jgi:hypothetical protein
VGIDWFGKEATLAAQGYAIARGFLDDERRRALRAACDEALARVRDVWSETGHTTPRITLDVAAAYELFADARVIALLPIGIARLRTVHYYHEQTKKDWNGDWHRDEGEVHVRVALEDDDCLEIVPASHLRPSTPDELRIQKGADRASDAMPNARRIVLAAGDLCVFEAATIHRALYRREPMRRTIDAVYAGRA